MGQKKGNPTPSYQNQGYENLYPSDHHKRDLGTTPVMIDDDRNLDELIDSSSWNFTKGYAKDTDLTDGSINASFDTITANEYHVTIYTSSILFASGSTHFGNTLDDMHEFTGSVSTTGQAEFGGNLVPKIAKGATLGTIERPFREIFLQSGSISIESDTPGDPSAIISNKFGNLEISVGGMLLVEPAASFIAPTGSFDYVSVSGSVNLTGSFYVNGNKQFNYGQFSDTTIQSGSANTAYPMKLNTTDLASGFSIVDGTKITATNTGTYNLQFSAQLLQTTNNSPDISIWFRKNGTNIPNSNTNLTIEKVAGGGKLVAGWNYIVQLNATEYVELMWSSTRSDTQLHYDTTQSTPTRPATPSVIVTMTQIA